MQHILTRLKIKSGKTQATREFLLSTAQDNQSEMHAILTESGLKLDCSFIDTINGEDYLYIFKQLDDLETLKTNLSKSTEPFWQKIRDWTDECLEEGRVDLQALAVFEG